MNEDNTLPIIEINDASQWRAFDEAELSHSAAHYLTSIMHLRRQYGYARVTDVAEHLKVSRGAASRAISLLKERNWITEDPRHMLELTQEGMDRARSVERNFLIAESFLEAILGVPREIAREDACKMEHLLSPETTGALFRLTRVFMRNKPMLKRLKDRLENFEVECGDDKLCVLCEQYEGCIAADVTGSEPGEHCCFLGGDEIEQSGRVCTLADLKPGARGRVHRVLGRGAIHRRILDMGISRGVEIEVEREAPLRDPIKIKLRGYALSLRKAEAQLIEMIPART